MQVKLGTLLCKVPDCTVKINSISPVGNTGIGRLEGSLVINGNDDLLDICIPISIRDIVMEGTPGKKALVNSMTLVELLSNCPPATVTVTNISFELVEQTGWSVIEFKMADSEYEYTVVSYIGIQEIIGTEAESKVLRRKLK